MNGLPPNKHLSKISSIIDFEKLERESMKFFYSGLVIGMLINIMAGYLISYTPPEFRSDKTTDTKHIKIDLITLPPSAKNPYENWKRVFTKRSYTRKIIRLAVHGGKFTFKGLKITVDSPRNMEFKDFEQAKEFALNMQTDNLDTLIADFDPVNMDAESYYKYRELTMTREPEDRFSLLEEMISLDDIDDLGMYKGFVIQDPNDKQNIRGYFHIPQYFTDLKLNRMETYNLVNAVEGLSEAFNYYTGLELKIDNPASLSSPNLFQYPVVYLTTDTVEAFEISDYKAVNFGNYLKGGGLAIIENGRPWLSRSPAQASLLTMLLKAFDNNIKLKEIPRSHPLYYCFFEFDSLIPAGAEKSQNPDKIFRMKRDGFGQLVPDIPDWGELLHNKKLDELMHQVSESPASLWGVWAEERLVAIYSDKGYGHSWQAGIMSNKSRDFASGNDEKYNFNPQLKLGVNMLVYALIQRGGIAKQLTDYSEKNK
jgi:hypothetical protein